MNAGNMLQQGMGGPRDLKLAAHYYELAAPNNASAASMLEAVRAKVCRHF